MRLVRRLALFLPLIVVGMVLLIPGNDGDSSSPRPPAAVPQEASRAAQPIVDGARLVDARSGETFVPVGVNWTGFEYPCAQGWGYSELDRIAAELGRGAPAEMRAIVSWGSNTLRLPVNQDCWLGTRQAPLSDAWTPRDKQGYRERVIEFVHQANEAGLVVIVDLHSRKRPGQAEFGNLAMPDRESLLFWSSVAAVFRDSPSVLFDAFNEPYSRYDDVSHEWAFELDWVCWRDGGCRPPAVDDRTPLADRASYEAVGMADVVAAIRAAGASQPILLSGLDYANDLSGWVDHSPDDSQIVASFHSYDFKACADSACWERTLGKVARTHPVVVAEIGQSSVDSTYVVDFLAWARGRPIGLLAWAWADHIDDPMSLVRPDRRTPTRSGSTFRSFFGMVGTGDRRHIR